MGLRLIYIIIFLSSFYKVFGQDIHFSQFYNSPLNLNPALTGYFDGDYRFVANHRNQWSSITVPYVTFSASVDSRYSNVKLKKTILGLGLTFNSDKAGDGDFGTNQIILSFAAHRAVNIDSTIILSVGANIGLNQNSVDYNKFYFGNQYSNGQFNSNLPNYEYFSKDNLTYVDFSLGLNSKFILQNKVIEAGVSAMHLNSPEKSFYESKASKLPNKFTFYAKASIPLQKHYIIPGIVYFRQAKFNELYIGGEFKYFLNNLKFRNLYFGLWTRTGDAAIVKMALDYNSWYMGISYDINYSKLTTVSSGRGGYEISIIYIIKKSRAISIPLKYQCPDFM